LDLRSLIDLGGFLGKGQDTKDRTKITRKSKGLIAKRPYLLPFDRADRGKPGGGGGLGGRCSGELGARVAGAAVGKDCGELGDALTSGGERQEASRRRTPAATDGHGGRRLGFGGGAGIEVRRDAGGGGWG
jgi:hypothetical protein